MSAPTTGQWLRTAAQRISCGSGRLCTLIARRVIGRGAQRVGTWKESVADWLGEVTGIAWLVRLALLAGVALIARKILLAVGRSIGHAHAPEGIMWILTAAWLIAAYRIGHPDWQPKPETDQPPASETEDAPDEDAKDEPAAEPPTRPAPPTLDQLRAARAAIGTPHAHVAALAEHLGTTTDLVREGLAAAQIPVGPVRMKGRGSSTGVRGEFLPAPPGPSSATPAGVVAAGQPANNDNNNASTVERPVEGMLIVRDPIETASRRHAV